MNQEELLARKTSTCKIIKKCYLCRMEIRRINNEIITLYNYDPVGNVTQVTSTYPWLPNQSFTENFSYDNAYQLINATDGNGSYNLQIIYDYWGKIHHYNLEQQDIINGGNHSFKNYDFDYPEEECTQTSFAPRLQHGTEDIEYTYGINGSLRKREVHAPDNYIDYYLFNSQGNMKAYSNDGIQFAYYGYDAANTRTYKLSMSNSNSWVNGAQQNIDLQLQQAMFYPNAYLNFDNNGNYTKHYYNGTERIVSRLGTENIVIANDDEDFEERRNHLRRHFNDDIQELLYAEENIDTLPEITISYFQPTGSPEDDIFYYHTNHLGSTAFVTDNNSSITQGFVYAPFGEIVEEYNANFGNNTIPKYSFNAKELDEETGMYYYEARYYAPPTFTSRDPLMNEKPWLTPYHYCSNNPVGRIDPTGCEDWEPENIDKDKNYKVIAIFPANYKDDKALSKDVKAAQKAGMPMFFVDDINDFANAMQEGLADIGSSTESYVINNHGFDGFFSIGATEITHESDVSILENGLKDKTVFLYACNVASGKRGEKLLPRFSSQTSSTVIGATEELIAGYKFKGGSGLNYHGNTFKISEKGSTVNTIYDVSIHKDKGIKYKTQVPSISIFKNVNY